MSGEYFKALNLRVNNLYNDYCDDCWETEFQLNLNDDEKPFKKVDQEATNAYKKLHKEKAYRTAELFEKYGKLIDTTNAFFQSALTSSVKDGVIPEAMMKALQEDIFVFSAVKTHAQLSEVSRLLLDDNGLVKSWHKFSEDVANIKTNYNQNYLKSEYQFAVSSSQQAANWQDASSGGGRYNLQYRTAKDERVRKTHEALHGITLPVDDAFWKEYYPPNGWRCRCTATEVLKSKYKASDSEVSIEAGERATTNLDKDGNNRFAIFRFNPGMQKVIFPPNHPYNKVKGARKVKSTAKKNGNE